MTGDAPLDALGRAHARLVPPATGTEGGTAPRLTLAQLLRVWQDALNQGGAQWLADATGAGYQLAVVAQPVADGRLVGEPQRHEAAAQAGDPALQAHAAKALRTAALSYGDALDRRPRLNEMRACLQLSLGNPAAQGWLADGVLEILHMDIDEVAA